jgi:hypothetical protein
MKNDWIAKSRFPTVGPLYVFATGAPLWSKDASQEPVPVTSDGERTLPDARR